MSDGEACPEGASLVEIERIYRCRFQEFLRLAAAVTGERDAAYDVVQDAFAALIRKRRSFASRGSLEGWIWRGVANTALNRRAADVRSRRPLTAVSERNEALPWSTSPTSPLAEALAALPERQRLVVFLRYYADLDYAAIADTLEISVGTVSSTLHGAHRTLRETLSMEALQ